MPLPSVERYRCLTRRSKRPDALEKRPATHAVHDVAPERQSQLFIRIQISLQQSEYAPDALENSPGSHAAQALAPATQAQMHSGARCRWCKSPSVSMDDGRNSLTRKHLHSLTFADLRWENRTPVCTSCTLPNLLEIKDQLQHLGWSLSRAQPEAMFASEYLPPQQALLARKQYRN